MSADPARSLHRKLAQIMYEAERIPKRGVAPAAMGGFPFVQVGDAADYIRKALAENVLTMMPTGVRIVGQVDRPTKSGGTMTTVDLITTWTITDGESGETITVESFGAGADGGDKYSGKASTSAMKYALLTTFLLSTGEDSELGGPEAGAPEPKGKPKPEAKPEPATYTDIGERDFTGVIAKGDGQFNDAQFHQDPEGHRFGFRLNIAGSKSAIHEVIVDGALGEALFLAAKPEELLGAEVWVAGLAQKITQPPRAPRSRLIVSRIKGPTFEIPAAEAPSEPMFVEGSAKVSDLDNLPW